MPIPRPFTIHVPDQVLADLRMRLERIRWPDENPGGGWQYGSDIAYMKALVTYWREKYDWRANEARLNRLRQFVVPIDGIDLHFIHESGVGPDPLPLLLSHGWPGSIVEFERLIPLLTDPGRWDVVAIINKRRHRPVTRSKLQGRRPAVDHIGIDLHKRESQICIETELGEIIEKRIRTDRERLEAVLGGRSPAKILIEAMTESEWVARFLEELGHEVIVADPNCAFDVRDPVATGEDRSARRDDAGGSLPPGNLSARPPGQ